MTYYKATRPDGWDFHTGTVDYAAAINSAEPVRHPRSGTPADMLPNEPSTYLSVSVEPGEVLLGGSWPCRLFEVEPVGGVVKRTNGVYPSKRGCVALRVVRELPSHLALGPNGEAVAALIEAAGTLTSEQAQALADAWDAVAGDAAREAAGDAAREAAWGAVAGGAARDAVWGAAAWGVTWGAARDAVWGAAAWGVTWDAAWGAARDAVCALVVRDLITPEQFEMLYGPWATVMGP